VVAGELLPWALAGADLGGEILEIGPGYGRATGILCERPARLTCVELDEVLARALSLQSAGSGVRVVQADAASLPFPDRCFSAVVCFTMLHHVVPTRQDLLLAEVARALRPGGTFLGTDTYRGVLFRLAHWGDTLAAVDPDTLPQRLRAAGFAEAAVERRGGVFRFRARR
jgi:SAM-dependent methyltransferase